VTFMATGMSVASPSIPLSDMILIVQMRTLRSWAFLKYIRV
jgi:hypothetical protein